MVSRLVHSVVGLIVSISSATYAMLATHGPQVAVIVSIVAGLYTIRAARATIKLRKAQQAELKSHEVHIRYPGRGHVRRINL